MLGWDAIGAIAGVVTLVFAATGGTYRWLSSRAQKKSIETSIDVFEEVGFEWILERRLSYVALLKRLIAIDVASIDHLDYNDPAEGTAGQWAPVFEYSKDTWRLIIYNGITIVAYWQAVSLKPNAVARLKRGSLKDSRILIKDIRKIEEEGPHSIYFIYIGRHPDYEKKFAKILFSRLMESVCNFCAKLDQDGILIRDVFANGQTEVGENLCKTMEMNKVTSLSQGGDLYHALYRDLNWKWLRKFKTEHD